ncbi:ATP-dependent RNA helicase DEAH11, chloroplastic [Gracilariopsis chorda]|uniref:RBR-type E3 ubiquitin transferase n=1 Tax=Gracilariopsis chorda TaxID=448386 RepID=A0A2V3IWI4_9FLOR|nr:ATP-dependent RNA helicase DEAH11, chloroplastic [Gracilariopsis chorda]|eukprot:PXF46498.1 ATP-dependent RNA helicase DEAH11, chloroplastic [Gracilariopsis chorda]
MSTAASDYLVALKLQLQENGADDFNSLHVLSTNSDESLSYHPNQDLVLAYTLEAANRRIVEDYALARAIAAKENGLPVDVEDQNKHQLSSTKNAKHATSECQICFEAFVPNMTFNSGTCDHTFCFSCMSQYLKLVVQRGHPYPINCPSCRVIIPNEKCLSALSGTGKEYEALERLIINKDFTKRIRYCANSKCAMPFDWVFDNAGAHDVREQARVMCPFCDTETCALCRCVWHEDQTCEEHSLQKDMEELSVLSRQNNWRRCPDCGHLIEKRTGDCAFVTCKCGCGFCHTCGSAYTSLDPTWDNVHGRPGCRCALFPEPEEPEEPEEPALPVDNILPRRIARRLNIIAPENDVVPEDAVDVPVRANARANVIAPERIYHDGLWGPNGRVNLRLCLEGRHQFMGAPLPQAMIQSLENWTCPYEECEVKFRSLRALEQHLAFVQRHQVHLCCARPFYTCASMMNHIRNNHTNVMIEDILPE